jgi:hypothetical protein
MIKEADFFSVNKQYDWNKGTAYNINVSDQGLSIIQTYKYNVTKELLLRDIEGPQEIVELAVGRGGKLFVLDKAAGLWQIDLNSKHVEPIFRYGHELFTHRAAMYAIGDTLIISDPSAPERLAAYTSSTAQTLWSRNEWNGLALLPLAHTTDGVGHVYVLVPLFMGACGVKYNTPATSTSLS